MAQFVGGRYQLIAQLGGGGMADVYLAKLTGKADFAKLAVVKRLKPLEDDDAEIVRMFADEARLCARLNHPSIVQTFEVGEDTAGPFLVMEYIEGQPLGRIRSRASRREKTIPRAIALKILCDTIDALAYAHGLVDHDGTQLRVVHRDVSPENIMVTYMGNTKLVDFGVAKTSASASVTRAGVLKGKVAYMAPEQARSDVNIDGRADVFAAGLILWELLTTKRMWEGMSEAKVFERLLDREPLPRPSSIDATIPTSFDDVCMKAMAKEKEDRYATASDFLDGLEKACGEHNLRASDREIGQFVASLFEVEREKVKNLVSGSVVKTKDPQKSSGTGSGIESTGGSLPQVRETASLDPTIDGTPPPDESDPLVWRALSSGSISSRSLLSTSSEGSSMPAETPAGTSETRHAEPPRKKVGPMKVVLAIIAVLGLVGVAVVIGTRINPVQPPPKPAPPVVASSQPTPVPTPTVLADVAIDIAVKPTSAKIYVDGKLAPSNPYRIKTKPGDASHELRAEADGYESRSMVVSFDRDRALDMVVKSTTTVAANNPPSTPRTAAVPTSPTPTHAPTSHASTSTAPTTTPPSPTTKGGISEIDPSKPRTGAKQPDKIDTDVFKR